MTVNRDMTIILTDYVFKMGRCYYADDTQEDGIVDNLNGGGINLKKLCTLYRNLNFDINTIRAP